MTPHIPGPDTKRGHRGSCCCFQMVQSRSPTHHFRFWRKKSSPRCRTCVGRPSSAMKYSSARAWATYTGKQFSVSLVKLTYECSMRRVECCDRKVPLSHREEYSQISLSLLASECCVLSLFPFPSLLSAMLCTAHGQTISFHGLPMRSQGASYIPYLWTANTQIPSNPSWGRPGTACGCNAAG